MKIKVRSEKARFSFAVPSGMAVWAIKKMGYETRTDQENEEREAVLKALERGEITAEEAIAKLK